jgi:plasmid stability protein
MAQLLIRDLDGETIERLKERAKQHRRSLQGEVKLILEHEAAAGREDSWALADRIRTAFGSSRFSSSADLIRQDRDR